MDTKSNAPLVNGVDVDDLREFIGAVTATPSPADRHPAVVPRWVGRPRVVLALPRGGSCGGRGLASATGTVAPLAAIVAGGVLAGRGWAGRTMIPGAIRELRGNGNGNGSNREPATTGVA